MELFIRTTFVASLKEITIIIRTLALYDINIFRYMMKVKTATNTLC